MEPKFSIANIDHSITFLQGSLSLYPRSHPEHVIRVHILTNARFLRYSLSQQKEDLDKSILNCTEAIFLPPVSQAGFSLNVVELLFHLAFVLLNCSERFKQPCDIKYSIEYLRYLRGLSLDSFDVPRNTVTTSLIRALAIQVRLEAGGGTRNIKEMVALCLELLTSDSSADSFVAIFSSLNDAVNSEAKRGLSVKLLDEVTECLRDAVKMCSPGSQPVLFALLANILCTRFIETHSKDDYEEATALLETTLDPNQPGECPDSILGLASAVAVLLAFSGSIIFQNSESYEVAISRHRALLTSPSIDERFRFQVTKGLEFLVRERFKHYNLAESLEEANSYTSQVVDILSSQSLGAIFHESIAVRESYLIMRTVEKIQHLEELLSNTPPGAPHDKHLRQLSRLYETKFSRTNNISDIEESIKYGRRSLDATRYSSDMRRTASLNSLYLILLVAFKKTRNIKYLDESITVNYDILELKSAQYIHFYTTRRLVPSLLTRSRLLNRREDRHEAIRLMSLAVHNESAQEPDRFQLSCQWARLARIINHPSALSTYKSAMSLLQKSLSFAPTIRLGQFEEAVETLEQGRALLWSEMRGLRSPMAQLVEEDSPLAKRFAEINQELEELTISVTPSGRPEVDDGGAQGIDLTDPLGRLVVKRQILVKERDALVSQIQSRSGFEGFLKTPSFTTLRSAASHGPVILINHCKLRSDILILFHKSLPCFLPTPNDFYDRATELRDKLMKTRKAGLDSSEYQRALRTVLRDLYELVGQPPEYYAGAGPASVTSCCPTDESLPAVWGEIEVMRNLNVPVTSLISKWVTPSSVVEALRGHRFAHFACHGNLERGKPFDASFRLHNGERLTLLDIVRSRLPNAEFAFLSCCHTAEITEESIADEALHLTAAIQYCGFRSVVGTMWAMADTDGRDLAENFYKSLFSSREQGVPYYERSARALRDAARKLRRKEGISLERWVNFVHYGA
ncbi:CHAT domain-containing protein [Lactarius deliciosus]|nr:CHAT domain-containing protein [Lactarius deliciosus]